MALALGAVPAQSAEPSLEAAIRAAIQRAPARRVAVYLEDRVSGKTVAVDADRVFASASLMKIPIAALTLQKWERTPALRTARREKMLRRMLNASNNRDADALVKHVGGRRAVNLFCDRHGWPRSELHHPSMPGGDRRYKNSTTAREIGEMLGRIDDRKLVSRAASETMWRAMQRGKYVQRIPAGLPEEAQVTVANKTGTMRFVLHDAAIIRGAGRHYILVILTYRYRSEAAGEAFCRRLSRLVYQGLKPR